MNINSYLKSFDVPTPEALSWAKKNPDSIAHMWAVAMGEWVKHPVVFRPSEKMVAGMAHTEINIPPAQYHQSYDAIMIQHPDGVLSLVATIQTQRLGRVLFVVHTLRVNDDKGGRYCFLCSLDGRLRMPNGQPTRIIEDAVVVDQDFLPPEQQVAHPYLRVAINSALLLACYPVRRVHTDRERQLRKAAKSHRRHKAVAAKAALALLPQVIDFVEQPTFYEEQGTPTGGTKRPHWRKGHFRMQAYGHNWEQHRLIFVKAILVHRESAKDQLGAVEYIGKDASPQPRDSDFAEPAPDVMATTPS